MSTASSSPQSRQAQVAMDPAVHKGPVRAAATPMRILTMIGLAALLVWTTALGMDVGVTSLVVALVPVSVKSLAIREPTPDRKPTAAVPPS
jgi:hypothetical protein